MDKESVLFAKIAGLQKNFSSLNWRISRVSGPKIDRIIEQYFKIESDLRELLPDLYSDLPVLEKPTPISTKNGKNIYNLSDVSPIAHRISYILEVRANHRIGEKKQDEKISDRVFLSHGTSSEWYKVQTYLEKDLELNTLELAQEANLGRTILQKLNEEANKCNIAVIVMTGDDEFEDEVRARENVMHEIGFFQGRYGLSNVVLLHEENVSIPSNIHGLVYIPFPKETVEAAFGALQRELKVLRG